MLRIEALEIADDILDKIESRRSIVTSDERARACTRSSVKRRRDATCWWCWSTWAAAFGESSPRVR